MGPRMPELHERFCVEEGIMTDRAQLKTMPGQALLPVHILMVANENNGGLVRFPSGREIILSKADAAALAAPLQDGVRMMLTDLTGFVCGSRQHEIDLELRHEIVNKITAIKVALSQGASKQKSDGSACGNSSQASQRLSGDLEPGPSDPLCQVELKPEPVAYQLRQRSGVGKGPQSQAPWGEWCGIEREIYDMYIEAPNKLVEVRALAVIKGDR